MPVRNLGEANRGHEADEALDVLGRAGELEHERGQRGVEGARVEGAGEPQRLDAVVAGADDLDEAQMAKSPLAYLRLNDSTAITYPGVVNSGWLG